ncbi:MAG: TRAFs-binding domain-containing protein [Planctomycetota bacterium]
MPFGVRKDDGGRTYQFDDIYRELFVPAIEAAGMEPLRADEEYIGGFIHRPMFERLVLAPYALVDMTTGNPNVFYELGVRHAVREHSTVAAFAEGTRLPFDVAPLRSVIYRATAKGLPAPETLEDDQRRITESLENAREARSDSPLFQLLDGMAPPDVSRVKTDVFRERVDYEKRWKSQLANARREGVDALRELRGKLEPLRDQEAGVVADLFLSFRAVKAWEDMLDVAAGMHPTLANVVMVREQKGFALNRLKRRGEAADELKDLIEDRGKSSETLGILGRVYKDLRDDALAEGDDDQARAYLKKAIEVYLEGFEADTRDAYPGVNAVTLMEIAEPPDPRRDELIPVVEYAVRMRMKHGEPDYWDHATLLELAVLAQDESKVDAALDDALACVREVWEPETTRNNMRLIREARESRGESTDLVERVDARLEKARPVPVV